MGNPSASGPTGYSPWLPGPSLQHPDVYAQAIPSLCYGAEDMDAGMYALDGQPKTVEEAVDRMQFFQHSRQGRPPKPKRDVRAVTPEEEPQGTGNGRPSRKIQDLQSRRKELERALQPVQPNPTQNTSPPRAAVEERSPPACYKCGEVGHYRRNCPRNSGAKVTGNTGGTGPAPSRIGGPPPKRKVQMDSGQEPGTEHPGDPERCGCSSQSVLSL